MTNASLPASVFTVLFKPIKEFKVPPSPHCMSCCLHDPGAGPHGSDAANREA